MGHADTFRRSLRLAGAIALSAGLMTACEESPTTPTPDVTPPPVPQQVSPANGTEFTHFPRSVTLVWNAVTDPSAPVTYRVQAQFCSSADPSSCTDRPDYCPGEITDITCMFNFVGGQPGRWRVLAVDAEGNTSAYSSWWTFSFDS